MKKVILSLFFLTTCICLFGQRHQENTAKIDVQHYRFEMRLTDDHDTIEGIATVKIKFKKDVETFELDLVNEKD